VFLRHNPVIFLPFSTFSVWKSCLFCDFKHHLFSKNFWDIWASDLQTSLSSWYRKCLNHKN
jgi:hypothetical protein